MASHLLRPPQSGRTSEEGTSLRKPHTFPAFSLLEASTFYNLAFCLPQGGGPPPSLVLWRENLTLGQIQPLLF